MWYYKHYKYYEYASGGRDLCDSQPISLDQCKPEPVGSSAATRVSVALARYISLSRGRQLGLRAAISVCQVSKI